MVDSLGRPQIPPEPTAKRAYGYMPSYLYASVCKFHSDYAGDGRLEAEGGYGIHCQGSASCMLHSLT